MATRHTAAYRAIVREVNRAVRVPIPVVSALG